MELSSATMQAETVKAGLQDAVEQMHASNTDVSQKFRLVQHSHHFLSAFNPPGFNSIATDSHFLKTRLLTHVSMIHLHSVLFLLHFSAPGISPQDLNVSVPRSIYKVLLKLLMVWMPKCQFLS